MASETGLSKSSVQRHRLLFRDLLVGESSRQPQDDPSPENLPLTAGFSVHDAHEFSVLTGAHFKSEQVLA